ncbi:MAG TPA: hypothetical protein VKB38_12285 [Terracidiphilus sp.]|nr:hypothetical protein [Terracidiphilus sp.]
MSHIASENPLALLFDGTVSKYDFAVMEHGFAPHGRDYRFVIEDTLCKVPGTYELTFTHVVNLSYETRVSDTSWPISWADEFTDYAKWQAAGEPEGYVFGTNWSLAYPGMTILHDTPEAKNWSTRLQRTMHSVRIETDRFSISLIFGGVRHQKVSDETGTLRKVLFPLSGPKTQ